MESTPQIKSTTCLGRAQTQAICNQILKDKLMDCQFNEAWMKKARFTTEEDDLSFRCAKCFDIVYNPHTCRQCLVPIICGPCVEGVDP